MSEKDFKDFCEYYERIKPKKLGALLEDYNNRGVKGFLKACQNTQIRYLNITDFDNFKHAKSLPGISNLFGISKGIERQFNTGFPGLYSPGDPSICRCNN